MGPDGAELTIGGSRATAPVLVGADGANGVVARTLGLGGGIEYGIALEGNGPLAARQRGLATVEVGVARAATAGSSRSSTTRTTASAAGRVRARASASTCAGSVLRTGSTRRSSPTCAAPGCRCGEVARRRRGRCCSSATRRASSTHSPATAFSRHSYRHGSRVRRSSAGGTTDMRSGSWPPSAVAPPPAGKRSACSTATRASPSKSAPTLRVGGRLGHVRRRDRSSRDVHGLARPPLRLLARL